MEYNTLTKLILKTLSIQQTFVMMVSLMPYDYASTVQTKKNSFDHNYFSRQVCYVCHYGIATSRVEKSKAYKIKNKATNFLAHNGVQVVDNDNGNQ